jgi:hypothetical protein
LRVGKRIPKACSDRSDDSFQLGRVSGRREVVAQRTPQDAMMQCMQGAAAAVAKAWSSDKSCDGRQLIDAVGILQRAQFAYSAIQPIQTPSPSQLLSRQITD